MDEDEEEEGRPEAETFPEANSVAALLFVTNWVVWYCSTADTPVCCLSQTWWCGTAVLQTHRKVLPPL